MRSKSLRRLSKTQSEESRLEERKESENDRHSVLIDDFVRLDIDHPHKYYERDTETHRNDASELVHRVVLRNHVSNCLLD